MDKIKKPIRKSQDEMDILIAEERKSEKSISWDKAKLQLKKNGKL